MLKNYHVIFSPFKKLLPGVFTSFVFAFGGAKFRCFNEEIFFWALSGIFGSNGLGWLAFEGLEWDNLLGVFSGDFGNVFWRFNSGERGLSEVFFSVTGLWFLGVVWNWFAFCCVNFFVGERGGVAFRGGGSSRGGVEGIRIGLMDFGFGRFKSFGIVFLT